MRDICSIVETQPGLRTMQIAMILLKPRLHECRLGDIFSLNHDVGVKSRLMAKYGILKIRYRRLYPTDRTKEILNSVIPGEEKKD
jgi:hypothetical protein